jgi:hypothetical protein
MGPSAKSAIPALRKMLGNKTIGDDTTIRIVLANLGDESKENLETILADFKNIEKLGCFSRVLPFIKPGGWVKDEMLVAMADPYKRWLGTERRPVVADVPGIAIQLGQVGQRAASVKALFDVAQDTCLRTRDISALPVSLALARIDPKQREEVIRRLLAGWSSLEWGRGADLAGKEYAWQLLDARLSKCLAGFLADPNTSVAQGAILYLYLGGLASREAVPQVLSFIQSEADEELRASAAETLAAIAEYKQLPKLEATLKNEKSERVRKGLKEAIRIIKFLPTDSGL